MSTKLRLSKETSNQLNYLSSKLGLRRNIICRLAIGRSLSKKESVKNLSPEDSLGYEFNRPTITGEHDKLFHALIIQHENKKLNDFEFFSKYLRNHIERGIGLLNDEYNRINSPIDFLIGMMEEKEIYSTQFDLFQDKNKG